MRSVRLEGLAALLVTATLSADQPLLHCQAERYYEGDTVACFPSQDLHTAEAPELVTFTWSILGKELKRDQWNIPWPVNTLPGLKFQAPTGLKTVTPLRLEAIYHKRNSDEAIAAAHVEVQLFPRNPKYWVGENEFKGKTILLNRDAAWIAPELGALGIPHLVDNGRELSKLRRFDLQIENENLKGFDRTDPWCRWWLVQFIRHGLSHQSGAKESGIQEVELTER